MINFHRTKFRKPVFLRRGSPKTVGYAGGLREGENYVQQIADLRSEGCSLFFFDSTKELGIEKSRPQLDASMLSMCSGDELVVCKLHCLGDTQAEILRRIHQFLREGLHIRTVGGGFDSKLLGSQASSLVGLLCCLDEVNCLNYKEGTLPQFAGVNGKRNNVGGRPKTNPAKEALVLRLRNEGCSYRSVRNQTGLSLSTIRRIILDNQK